MSIHPIDLTGVYSQMDNVAKFNASQNQLAQAMANSSLDQASLENLEKSKAVQETSKNEVMSDKIKKDGSSGGQSQGYGSRKRKQGNQAEEEETEELREFRDPRLGAHIDITG